MSESKLVPVEPTLEMCVQAGFQLAKEWAAAERGEVSSFQAIARNVLCAGIAAAPLSSLHLPADRVAEAIKYEVDLWKDANHRLWVEEVIGQVAEKIAALLPESQRAEFVRRSGQS